MLRVPGQGKIVEALRGGPGTGWKQEGPEGIDKKDKNAKIMEENEVDVVQSVLSAYGRLKGQNNAIGQLYKWVTRSCHLEKNWRRYKQKMVKKCENWKIWP